MSDDGNKTNDLKYSLHAQTFPSVKNDRIILQTRVNWFTRDEKKKMNNQSCDRSPRSFRHYYINVSVGGMTKGKESRKRGKIVGRLRVLSLARQRSQRW